MMNVEMIYLDYNCFQRWFDDHSQMRIYMEALACQEIFSMAQEKKVTLVWSFMHLDETAVCPFPERKYEALRLSRLCSVRIGPEEDIHRLAVSLDESGRLGAKDTLHLACAIITKCDYFLTCDDKLVSSTKHLSLEVHIMNPVEYILKVVK
ncbi:MAG: type II toxin-antitoxin system VapC family toxin [Vulcanimicrobiota bacterium]